MNMNKAANNCTITKNNVKFNYDSLSNFYTTMYILLINSFFLSIRRLTSIVIIIKNK